MKSATTTLHQDLVKHPDIFCGKKELNALTMGDAQENYRLNYRDAKNHQLLGDVSATYTMLPDFPGVPAKAKSLLGPEIKIVYLVREPVSRALSHHQHMMNDVTAAKMGPDVNTEIRKHPAPINYSRYAHQLQPWIDLFGKQNIYVIKFEEYISDRDQVLKDLFGFLGVQAREIEIESAGANRGNQKRVAGKFIYRLYHTKLFQRIIKPFSPAVLRSALRNVLLRKSKVTSIPPTLETIDFIVESVQDDVRKLHTLLEWSEPAWDFAKVRAKYSS